MKSSMKKETLRHFDFFYLWKVSLEFWFEGSLLLPGIIHLCTGWGRYTGAVGLVRSSVVPVGLVRLLLVLIPRILADPHRLVLWLTAARLLDKRDVLVWDKAAILRWDLRHCVIHVKCLLLLVIVLQVRVVWRGLIVLHVLSLFLLLVLILWTVLVLVLSKVVLVEPTFLSKTSFIVVVIATVSWNKLDSFEEKSEELQKTTFVSEEIGELK